MPPTLPEDIAVVSPDQWQASAEGHVDEYWTSDRMAQAQPIEPDISEDERVALMAAEPWTQEGTQMVMESQPPDGSGIGDHDDVSDLANGFQTTRVPKADQDDMPYSAIGKVFMRFNDQDYVGSGWIVAENAVFTAGHCVFYKNNWADNVLFVPQYDAGAAPVGRWTATAIYSLHGWTAKNDYAHDMAVFLTDRPIRPATGSLGWMANHAPNQGPYKAVGFPARPLAGYNFNGRHLWQSVGGYIGGNKEIQMHNNMTKGCSGGPWLVTRNRNVYANGLNSFRYENQPGSMYSPYFGDGFLNLYRKVQSPLSPA